MVRIVAENPHLSTSIPGWVYIQRYLLFKYAEMITEEKRGFPWLFYIEQLLVLFIVMEAGANSKYSFINMMIKCKIFMF